MVEDRGRKWRSLIEKKYTVRDNDQLPRKRVTQRGRGEKRGKPVAGRLMDEGKMLLEGKKKAIL